MKAFEAVLLGRDKFFRAEVQFEVDESAGLADDLAEEEADKIAVALMTQGFGGRIEIDSIYEITRSQS